VLFGKIGVHRSRKYIFKVVKTLLPLVCQLCVIEDNEACIIIFSPIFLSIIFSLLYVVLLYRDPETFLITLVHN
jgi:hypothetical protein